MSIHARSRKHDRQPAKACAFVSLVAATSMANFGAPIGLSALDTVGPPSTQSISPKSIIPPLMSPLTSLSSFADARKLRKRMDSVPSLTSRMSDLFLNCRTSKKASNSNKNFLKKCEEEEREWWMTEMTEREAEIERAKEKAERAKWTANRLADNLQFESGVSMSLKERLKGKEEEYQRAEIKDADGISCCAENGEELEEGNWDESAQKDDSNMKDCKDCEELFHKDAEIKRLESDVAKVKAEQMEMEEMKKQGEEREAKLEATVQQLEATVDHLEEDVKVAEAHKAKLTETNEGWSSLLDRKKKQLEKAKREAEELKGDGNEAREREVTELRGENDELKSVLKTVMKGVEIRKSEKERLESELHLTLEKLEKLESQKGELEQQKGRLFSENANLYAEVEKQKSQILEMDGQIVVLSQGMFSSNIDRDEWKGFGLREMEKSAKLDEKLQTEIEGRETDKKRYDGQVQKYEGEVRSLTAKYDRECMKQYREQKKEEQKKLEAEKKEGDLVKEVQKLKAKLNIKECAVCFKDIAEIGASDQEKAGKQIPAAIVPCGHTSTCFECARACQESEENDKACPMCRVKILEVLPVYP